MGRDAHRLPLRPSLRPHDRVVPQRRRVAHAARGVARPPGLALPRLRPPGPPLRQPPGPVVAPSAPPPPPPTPPPASGGWGRPAASRAGGEPISARYPIVEAVTAALYVAVVAAK